MTQVAKPTPTAVLTARMDLAASTAKLPETVTDEDVDAITDVLSALEDEIISADPSMPGVQGTQLQLAIALWDEQAPLQGRLRALLEALAAALVLTPVPIFQSLAEDAA